jgi:hypothetical protein
MMFDMRALTLSVLLLLVAMLCWGRPAVAAALHVFHTPGYESPVRGDPDDLLMIAGTGFEAADRVVYQALNVAPSHPPTIPARSTADVGTAPIVQRGNPAYALTVRLPMEMQKGRAYRLWVVTTSGEWSEAMGINDPRPQWVTPSFVYSTADFAGFGRVVRVVGRNLEGGAPGEVIEVRLSGSGKRSYILTPRVVPDEVDALREYVATASLPASIAPGLYSVAVRRKGLDWIELADQKLEVRPDPPALRSFSLDDLAFGGCRPDDAADDSPCLSRALEAARLAGGGIVAIPAGHWDLTTTTINAGPVTDGFVIPRNVQLRGAGAGATFIVRHGAVNLRRPDAMLTLTGHNSVVGLSFSDDVRFATLPESRPVIQLGGTPPRSDDFKAEISHLVEDVVISDNVFMHVGRAITDDAGRPIARLFITRNKFGAWSDAIGLPGNPAVVWEPFRIDDAVVRGNRFITGSYLDLPLHQGTLASGMGAGHHVDFSANIADGTSTENLQDPQDPPGFRAAFFWNMNNNVEMMLVSANQISCSGDKDGDGEAVGFDASGTALGFDGTPSVKSAGRDWVTLSGKLRTEHASRQVPANYYNGEWVQIVGGAGIGQTRKIVSYTQDDSNSTVTLHVSPAWDVVPGGAGSRVGVQRQYWLVSVVGNNIDHRSPPCHKSNLTGPNGGEIGLWTPTADVAIEANQQYDTDGIMFAQGYSFTAPSCPECGQRLTLQTGLEIRGNRVEGEYDWSSDCGHAGIRGTFGSSPTPESPPPVVGFGISISHNIVSHSDGPRGGGIDIPRTAPPGPPPGDWPFVENLLIFHNQIQDMEGPPPDAKCHFGQRERSGIRLEGHNNVRDTVLLGNRCERVATPLIDSGLRTLKICPVGSQGNCECADNPRSVSEQ